ncbi:MAG: patatin-like phospholipase family protein [Candidatus Heimdallarchaeota archaeon]
MKKKINNLKTAFVFSGGGSLGAIETGALKALVEHNIQADLIVGTSVGSLIGAMFAYNPTCECVQIMEEVWGEIRTRDVFPISLFTSIVNFATSSQYTISSKKLRMLISEKIPYTRIEETKLPLFIIGSDIITGEEVVFNKGLVLEALMASVGIPGIFPPQHMKNRLIVDGGMLNNTAISTAIRLGAERIIVFPIGTPSKEIEPKNVMQVIIRNIIFRANRQLATDILLYKNQVELIIIPPPDQIDVGPHDFSKSKLLIKQAYFKANEWLKTEGFSPNAETYQQPCDVHTPQINFVEAIIPKPKMKTITNLSENIKERKEVFQKTKDKTMEKIQTSLSKKKKK